MRKVVLLLILGWAGSALALTVQDIKPGTCFKNVDELTVFQDFDSGRFISRFMLVRKYANVSWAADLEKHQHWYAVPNKLEIKAISCKKESAGEHSERSDHDTIHTERL